MTDLFAMPDYTLTGDALPAKLSQRLTADSEVPQLARPPRLLGPTTMALPSTSPTSAGGLPGAERASPGERIPVRA
jgi:hypothetical protein